MQYSISNATTPYYAVFIQTLNKKPQAISCDGLISSEVNRRWTKSSLKVVEPIQVASDQRYKLGPLDARETVEFFSYSSDLDCFVCDAVPIFLRKCNLSRSSVLIWLQVTT